jgi:(2Fe-2S) ferredoxin
MEFYRSHILVCAGTNCVLNGSQAVQRAFIRELEKRGLDKEVKIVETGCFGICDHGPTVVIYPEGVLYCRVKEGDVPEIVEEHIMKGRIVERLLYKEETVPKAVQTVREVDYFKKQERIVLRNCGIIDPESIEEYIPETAMKHWPNA